MTTRPDPHDALLTSVRRICYDFAGTEERLSHGAPWFHVRGKGFVTFANDHHGDGRVAVWCKATLEAQRRLTTASPEVYFVPPYVGVKGWVGVRLDQDTTDFTALAILVEDAWLSVVPRRLEAMAPGAPPPPPVYPTTDPAVARDALARLTALTAALPGTVTEAAHGQTTFRVGKKPYAHLLDNLHRDGIVSVCVRVAVDEADALMAHAPRRYYRPPYIGARGWVAMRVDTPKTPWTALTRRVTESYRRAAPKRPM